MEKKLSLIGIDDSPRVKDWIASENNLYFVVKDLEGTKSLKIQDMNNMNKVITSFENLDKGETLVIVDTSKFKAEKDVYNLQIVAQENDSTYSQKSTQTISFKLSHEKVSLYPNSIKLNKTKITLDKDNEKTATLKVTTDPINATERTITWTSSNTKVATVDQNGQITAIDGGTATITAKAKNGKTAKCEVTVQAYSSSSSTKPKSVSGDGYTQKITLANRTYKLYKQYQGSYSTDNYNSVNNTKASDGSISNMGCGPSSVAIVLSGYGYNYDPGDIGRKLLNNSKPSSLDSMKKEVTELGRTAKIYRYNSDYDEVYAQMKKALSSGHQIVLYVGKGPGTDESAWSNFTSSGYHFISVLGIDTSNDKVYVGNPSKPSGWYSLSTVVKARGNSNGTMKGWLEIY